MVKLCVDFYLKHQKQFSPDLLSSGYLFSSAIDVTASDDLRGVGLAVFWFVLDFCQIPVPCDIPNLVDHLRFFFAQKYLFRCWLQVVQQE